MSWKKSTVMVLLLSIVVALSAFMPPEEVKYKNLKILPKNISKEELDLVMDNFKMALGVKCGHCHAPMKDNPRKLDFASDDKPEKEKTREMMRMTMKINKKYFVKEMVDGKSVNSVSCTTCHNGKTEPAK